MYGMAILTFMAIVVYIVDLSVEPNIVQNYCERHQPKTTCQQLKDYYWLFAIIGLISCILFCVSKSETYILNLANFIFAFSKSRKLYFCLLKVSLYFFFFANIFHPWNFMGKTWLKECKIIYKKKKKKSININYKVVCRNVWFTYPFFLFFSFLFFFFFDVVAVLLYVLCIQLCLYAKTSRYLLHFLFVTFCYAFFFFCFRLFFCFCFCFAFCFAFVFVFVLVFVLVLVFVFVFVFVLFVFV